MRTDYVPRRIAGDNSIKLAPKTVYNIFMSLASFFTWASGEFNLSNPMKNVSRPRVPEDAPVEPFKKDEIELLIKACDFCEEAVTDRRHKFIMQRSTGKRDKAILLTLLDTGLRASELCALRTAHCGCRYENRQDRDPLWRSRQSQRRQGTYCLPRKICKTVRLALSG